VVLPPSPLVSGRCQGAEVSGWHRQRWQPRPHQPLCTCSPLLQSSLSPTRIQATAHLSMGSAGQQQKIAGLRKITIYRTIICYNSFKKKKFYFLDFLLTLEQPSN